MATYVVSQLMGNTDSLEVTLSSPEGRVTVWFPLPETGEDWFPPCTYLGSALGRVEVSSPGDYTLNLGDFNLSPQMRERLGELLPLLGSPVVGELRTW